MHLRDFIKDRLIFRGGLLIQFRGITIIVPRLINDNVNKLMGAAPDVIRDGSGYTRVMFSGNIVILLLFLINAIFRGAGDAAISMRALWIANICNMILDPLLIFGAGPLPRLGVTGAAIATTIGRGMGVVYQFHRLRGRNNRFVIHRPHLRFDPSLLGSMLRLSGTGMFQILINTTSWIGLVRIVSSFGSQAVAGYTVAIRIVLFALLPAWGMANAAATMVGQALGAGKPDRAEASVWRAGLYNAGFLGVAGVLFVIFAPSLIGAFTSDPVVFGYGVGGLRTVSAGFLFYGFAMVLTSSFNGAGDTWTPTLLNLACFWCWEVPLAWFLARHLGWGPSGAYAAVAIAFSTLAVASALVFRRGRWKTRRV
jgi:putative MATE family efflux protein